MPKTPEQQRSSRVKNVAIVSPTTAAAPEVVAKIGPNDVLLGRGAPIINNEGNVRFRKVINARKSEYIASCRHQVKNKIAKEVITYIYSQKGRFLRKVDDTKDAEENGTTKTVDESTWVVADDAAILQKVKQALREQDTKNIGTNKNGDDDSPQVSGSHPARQLEQQQQHGIPPVPFDIMSSPSHQSLRAPTFSADNNASMLQLAYIQQQQERAAIVRELMTRQALAEDSSCFLSSPYGGMKRPFTNEFMMSPSRGGGGGQFYDHPSSMGYQRFPPDNVGLMNPYGFSQSQMMAVRGLASRLSPLSSCNAMAGSPVTPMQSGMMNSTPTTSGTNKGNKRARVGK